MPRVSVIALILLLLPVSSFAKATPASFSAARSLFATSSVPGNVYSAGASVVLTAPIEGDLSVFGGSVISAAPVEGDGLLLAGSVRSRAPVSGDLRAVGGSISVEESVGGDLVAFGFSVRALGPIIGNVFVAAADVAITEGASGPVTIYGNTISLAGIFRGDVHVVSSGKISLAPDTVIQGVFSYEAPEPAIIPTTVTIVGGSQYTNASYLPDIGTSRILALISVSFFIFARILGALILAGLLAGLFPKLAKKIVERAYIKSPQSILLTALLGFAVFVAVPVLVIMLLLTFVGIGLALLLLIAYILIMFLSFLYAGILLGSLYARRFSLREVVLWHDGVLGMLALSLIALVPVVGPIVLTSLIFFSAGALLLIFFHFAFSREVHTPEIL